MRLALIALAAAARLIVATSTVDAVVVSCKVRAEQLAAAAAQTVVDFHFGTAGNPLTNAIAGLTFNGAILVTRSDIIEDGKEIAGIATGGAAPDGFFEVTFSILRTSIGFDFPGASAIDLYDSATLVGTSEKFAGSGEGHFGGVISDVAFNHAVICDLCCGHVFVDTMYFDDGSIDVVPAPASLAVLGAALAGFGALGRRA